MTQAVVLAQACPAVLVPGGQRVTLPSGSTVTVVQALGGSITVWDDRGRLARIVASDAQAVGFAPSDPAGPAAGGAGAFSMDAVTEALKTVFDPEIPINVVDLGLVYACNARSLDDGSVLVEIEMSMTAPGCGMGEVLRDDARRSVSAVPGVSAVHVELVWDPPWDVSRLSDEARLELGLW